jgi:deazaflavin-dependent oxidoreductase (nitroreductase family)
MNQIMAFLLRSPLSGPLGNQLVLLTFTGRKSGKPYTTPLGYIRRGDTVVLFTDHAWYKNLLEHPSVTLHLQGKQLQGNAEVIHDDKELIARELTAFVQERSGAARAYNVKLNDSKQPDPASVQQAAQLFTLIYVHLV